MPTPPDIVAAIVTYLQGAMGGSLGGSPTNPAVWADYAGPLQPLPYAVVQDSGGESYMFQSNDAQATGYWTHVVSDGLILVNFYAQTKAQARALGIQCVRVLSDTVATLVCADGVLLELRASRADTVPQSDTGPGTPTVFQRVVTLHYRQQFPV